MIKNIFILGIVLFALTSCFKEDDPIAPHDKGPVKQEIIPMTQYYIYQLYFNLATGEQVSKNVKNDFDLTFACADTAFLIRLNTATFMKAAQTDFSDLTKVNDTTGLDWKFDKSDGNPDSTAFVNWMTIDGFDTIYSNKVYVINRGINELGFTLGLKKIVFHSLKNGIYSFTTANMDNSEMKDVFIRKKEGYNTVQYSFEEGGKSVQTEPETDNWDLLFTQYTTLLFTTEGDPYPYIVTGVLTNPGTTVAFDSTMVFNDIKLDDIIYMGYSTATDKIGYDWKELFGDINGGDYYYKARSNYNYLIRSKSGIYYKLRFTGFYDPTTGEKGYPTFEYQRL